MALNTLSEIVYLLKDTFLSEAKVIELEIPESTECAFAIQINPDNAIEAWNLIHSRIAEIGKYPVIVCDSEYSTTAIDWERSMRNSDFFSRSYYEAEQYEKEIKYQIDPKSIITRSKSFDIDKYIDESEDFSEYYNKEENLQFLQKELDFTEESFGKAPKLQEIGIPITEEGKHEYINFQRWLFGWEIANCGYKQEFVLNLKDWLNAIDLEDFSEDFFSHTHLALVLLTNNSCEILAYIDSYCMLWPGSESTIALFRKWQDCYEAEIMCLYGKEILLKVSKLPETPEEAFDLAVEHYAFSPD